MRRFALNIADFEVLQKNDSLFEVSIMKKLLVIVLILLLCGLSAPAEEVVESADEALQQCATLDEQLAVLNEVATDGTAALDTPGWKEKLTVPMAEELPLDLRPVASEPDRVDTLPEMLTEVRFIAVLEDCESLYGEDGLGELSLLGDFQARLPEPNRARNLSEAEAVLYVRRTLRRNSSYIGGEAYDNITTVTAFPRGGEAVMLYSGSNKPPAMGMGSRLVAASIPMEEVWSAVRPFFQSVISLEYPEGTASFRRTANGYALAGLDGAFERYEIPAEVEGLPVVGIEQCDCFTLEALVLPESLEWIGIGAMRCRYLSQINFPAALRRIADKAFEYPNALTQLDLNEGLEIIGSEAFTGVERVKTLYLPSTLIKIGSDAFGKTAIDCPSVAIPEGLRGLWGMLVKGDLLCAWLPTSVEDIANSLWIDGLIVCAPEGSYAAEYAVSHDMPFIACATPEDMPKASFHEDGDYRYGIVGNQAVLLAYTGSETEVTVPETLGGSPVTIIHSRAFSGLEALREVRFPETMEVISGFLFIDCPQLEAVCFPASAWSVDLFALNTSADSNPIAWVPAESKAREVAEARGWNWRETPVQ